MLTMTLSWKAKNTMIHTMIEMKLKIAGAALQEEEQSNSFQKISWRTSNISVDTIKMI